MPENHLRQPFGEECCEAEIKILKDSYSDYYFNQAPFNKEALALETYLIIGRRGSGKSSLAHYFTFQPKLKNARCIDVDEPKEYYKMLSEVAALAATTSEIAVPRIVEIWRHLIWSLIFEEFKDDDMAIAAARLVTTKHKGPAYLVREILKQIVSRFTGPNTRVINDDLEEYLTSHPIAHAKTKIIGLTRKRPVIIAIDSLERYAVNDEAMMRATAALIQCASDFNIEHASDGIHVKAFVSAEVFPHLCESEISNSRKYVRDPLYLHWRPKDLVRLVCWRFHKHLEATNNLQLIRNSAIDWSSFSDVHDSVWIPHFGEIVVNDLGILEKTFPYVIRHTQMRPRQIITLLNKVAKTATADGAYPKFDNKTLIRSIREAEKSLATEVINSYARSHKNVGKILDALTGIPPVFKGRLLDKKAPATASEWIDGNYSPSNFKQILTELGVVGRVRKWNKKSGIIEADFEYAMEDRLPIMQDDDCVLHPMFVEKLRADTSNLNVVIYPFPDHPDYQDFRSALATI